jgi:riboflavin kinase/FMN adenylyltransferase
MTETVLTLGTFDGVHVGHQRILRRLVALARAEGLPSVVATFPRPPRHFFHPPEEPSLLTSPDEREALLRREGVDRVYVLPFNDRLSRLTAEAFYTGTLRGRFRARHVVVGYDFAFGRDRAGDAGFLRRRGARDGVRIHTVSAVRGEGETVSSARLRRLIREGDLAAARALLGRFHGLSAAVVRGHGRGHSLGYPTANLDVPSFKILPPGVSLVRVLLPSGIRRVGLCNHGTRPTWRGAGPATEIHLLNFDGDLVGQVLNVEFLRHLRHERRFTSTAALVRQIRRDEIQARRLTNGFLP